MPTHGGVEPSATAEDCEREDEPEATRDGERMKGQRIGVGPAPGPERPSDS